LIVKRNQQTRLCHAQIGNIIFRQIYGRKAHQFLDLCDEAADENNAIEFPDTGSNVSFFKQRLLMDTSPALVQPDYERVRF